MTDKSAAVDDRQLTQYLLGLLPEPEAERLDEASIADDQIAARLRLVEDDLVDDYIRGSLATQWREPFELRFLASPRRRGGVKFMSGFLHAVDRASGGSTGPPDERRVGGKALSELRATAADRTRRPWKVFATLIAVAAVLLVACGVLLIEVARLRNGLTATLQGTAALDQHTQRLEQQLNDQRTRNDAMTRELDRARESTTPAPRAAVERSTVALVLFPQTRAGGPVPMLAVSTRVDRVAFELQLEVNDFPRYRVILIDPITNQAVWRSDPVVPTGDQSPSLSIALPSALLKPQHYLFALVASDATNAEIVGSYTFQVVRR